jgi:hypothetical protein
LQQNRKTRDKRWRGSSAFYNGMEWNAMKGCQFETA